MNTNPAFRAYEARMSPPPLDGLMRKPEVLRLLQCHEVTLWRMCRDNKFPKPVHITSRAVGWRRRDVMQWLRDLK